MDAKRNGQHSYIFDNPRLISTNDIFFGNEVKLLGNVISFCIVPLHSALPIGRQAQGAVCGARSGQGGGSFS